ncbi:MAG TPA: HlyD family secretion protein [Prochlorococcus sp.]
MAVLLPPSPNNNVQSMPKPSPPQLPASAVRSASAPIGEDEEALRIESRPSPVLPLVLAGTLSLLTLTAVGAAFVVKVDQIVSVPGKLVTRRSTQSLTTSESGVVTEVKVQEGERVDAGQPLVVLDPRVQRSDVNELMLQLQAEASRQASELDRIQARIVGLERQEAIDQRILARWRQLVGEGAARQLEVVNKERLLVVTRRELAEARRHAQTLRYHSERTQAELRASLVDARSKLDLVTLRAPVKGTVLDLRAQTGQVVNGDKPLLRLVPVDDLQAVVFAPNRDLAFIRSGQKAEIAITAYDTSLYGTLSASVRNVSEDALPSTQEYDFPHFPITLDLSRQNLEVKGQSFSLQPGMAVNAQIKLQKRTIFQLLFSRFTQSLDAVRTMR